MQDRSAGASSLIRELVENVTDVLWAMDMDLRFTYISPSVTRMRGYSVEEAMAQRLEDVLTPASLDLAMRTLSDELAGKPPQPHETARFAAKRLDLEQTHADGHTLWTEWRVTVLRDDDGRPTRILGVTRDITERKREEEHLKALASGLRSVLEAADELAQCPTLDAVYRRAVELAREMLGIERCAILVETPDGVRGTYGTDDKGNTTEEHGRTAPGWEYYDAAFQALDPSHRRWTTDIGNRSFWDGDQRTAVGEGWIATTLIRAGNQPLGVLVNDAALTDAPLDETTQHIAALYCSVLGIIIRAKLMEQALQWSGQEREAAATQSWAHGSPQRSWWSSSAPPEEVHDPASRRPAVGEGPNGANG